jgi:PD-(D/E)XK endonuclease
MNGPGNRKKSGQRHRERMISRRRQGILASSQQLEWLASKGALVWIPLGHSPNADLIAEFNGSLLRVQVKTSTYRVSTPTGHMRWAVSISTNGGNRSWTGLTKKFDPAEVDHLFVLVGDGRRWFIPAAVVEGSRRVSLGGNKYSEFEVERGQSIEDLVYPGDTQMKSDRMQGECLSGQKEQTVNLPAMPSQVRILPPPSPQIHGPLGDITKSERKIARSGHALLRQKRQTTIPKRPCAEAGLKIGDRMRVRSDGPGRVVLELTEAGELLNPE